MHKSLATKLNEAIQPVIEQTQRDLDRIYKDETQALKNRLQLKKDHYKGLKDPTRSIQPGQIWANHKSHKLKNLTVLCIVESINNHEITFGLLHDPNEDPKTSTLPASELQNGNWEPIIEFHEVADWLMQNLE